VRDSQGKKERETVTGTRLQTMAHREKFGSSIFQPNIYKKILKNNKNTDMILGYSKKRFI